MLAFVRNVVQNARQMARPSTFTLYDRLLGGDLEQRLRELRATGKSYMDIAIALRPDVEVDPSTIRRWCESLGVTNPEQVA